MPDSKDVVEQKSGLKVRRVLGWTALGLIAIVILVLVTGSGPSTEPVHEEQLPPTPPVAQIPESTSSKTSDPNAATNLPAQQQQVYASREEEARVEKTKKTLHHFQSLPDPPPPVALNKVEGLWWAESDVYRNKVFIFVDELNLAGKPYRAQLSSPDGTKLVVECLDHHPPIRYSNDDYKSGECAPLPIFTWIRMAVSDVITDPETDNWGITYRANDSSSVSDFLVKAICYPNGNCITMEEEAKRTLEKLREKARRGED